MTIVQRQTLELTHGTASYYASGSGFPVIISAGLGLTGRFYDLSFPAFAAAGLRLIVPDLPGRGATPGPRAGFDPDIAADFLIEFARSAGIRRAVWVGHSLGAQSVVRVAERRPDLTAGIVLAGPTAASGRRELLRQAWGLVVEAKRTTWRVIAAVARDYIRTSVVRYIGTWIRHGRDSLLDRLPRVQCPALVLAGDADPVCRPHFIELLRHRMPLAEVVWVRGGTHALPRGHPDEFNRVVVEFARRCSAGRADVPPRPS